MLDLADIRKKNAGQPDGYWKTTTTALCDEVERLQRAPTSDPSLDNIRRMLDDGVPVPPWLVRGLVERAEYWHMQWDFTVEQGIACEERYKALLSIVSAVRAWSDAIERCDGIVAAEKTLRGVAREL